MALGIARREGKATLPGSEALFLQRWLATAQKQKRFPKSTADDLAWLIQYARMPGASGRVRTQLERLWLTGSRHAGETDLHRLTRATETLKAAGWDNAVVGERDWKTGAADNLRCAGGFYVARQALNSGFSAAGKLVCPVAIRVRGDAEVFIRTMAAHGLAVTVADLADGQKQVTLVPPAE